MAESINCQKTSKTGVPFYVAVKSSNEVYYQMASLFQEVTQGSQSLSEEWLYRILKSRGVIIPGKKVTNNI